MSLLQGIHVQSFTLDAAAALANFVMLVILYRGFVPRGAVNSRARSHARRRKELRAALLKPVRRRARVRPLPLVRRLLERLQLTGGADVRNLSERLARAGWRSRDALTLFQGLRLAMPVMFGVVGFLSTALFANSLGLLGRTGIACAASVAGGFAPGLIIQNAAQRRRQKVQNGLPDTLDLFVICAEAGLSFDATMSRVAVEIAPTAPELADEFGLTAIELGFSPDRRQALLGLANRVELASVRSLVTTLAQTERYGTPLAESLRVLAREFRHDRMMKAEQKAARLPATLTVPMIFFILPPLFVVLLGPAIIQVMASLKG